MTPLDMDLIHFALVVSGVILSVWAMQLSGTRRLAGEERECIRWVRRFGLALYALSLLWSLDYAFQQNWTPWPPFLFIVAGGNLFLVASVLNGYRRIAVAPAYKKTPALSGEG